MIYTNVQEGIDCPSVDLRSECVLSCVWHVISLSCSPNMCWHKYPRQPWCGQRLHEIWDKSGSRVRLDYREKWYKHVWACKVVTSAAVDWHCGAWWGWGLNHLVFFSFLLNLLGWYCLIKLYRFQVYNSVRYHPQPPSVLYAFTEWYIGQWISIWSLH